MRHGRIEYLEVRRSARQPIAPKPNAGPIDFTRQMDVTAEARDLDKFDEMLGLPVRAKEPSTKPLFLCSYGKYTVWLVDDFAIRNTSLKNEEFSNFAIHADFPSVVPKDQIWISKNETEKDRKFYIANALKRLKELELGASTGASYDASLRVEQSLRRADDGITKRPGYLSEHAPTKPEIVPVPKGVYKRKLGTYKGYDVWIVNSEIVQDTYKTDWVDGGNNSVYHFIPPNELWLSDALDKEELKFVVWHEYVESWLMRNKGWTYDRAHRRASATEFELRKDLGYAV